MVWGAGAKGVTFVNLTDEAKAFIHGLIDINPKKQGKYVAKTGHKIFGVEGLSTKVMKAVLVMNENYFNEVAETAASYDVSIHALGKL